MSQAKHIINVACSIRSKKSNNLLFSQNTKYHPLQSILDENPIFGEILNWKTPRQSFDNHYLLQTLHWKSKFHTNKTHINIIEVEQLKPLLFLFLQYQLNIFINT